MVVLTRRCCYLSQGNNPVAFSNYGDVCLLCVILRGRETRWDSPRRDPSIDTIVGNKVLRGQMAAANMGRHHVNDELVLRESSQCVPVFVIRAPPAASSRSPRCPCGHTMQQTAAVDNLSTSRWVCGQCEKHGHGMRWCCVSCGSTSCFNCRTAMPTYGYPFDSLNS